MLFCKPSAKSDIIYEQVFERGHVLQFRSLNLKKDLNILHHWSLKHKSRFWQPEGLQEKLLATYQGILKSADAHAFIGMLDAELICLIDIYHLKDDELGRYIDTKVNDCRMHIVMAPHKVSKSGLSREVVQAFLHYFFSFTDSRYLYAAPDIHHTKGCRLAEKCKFIFLENIMLPSRAASLYLLRKEQFIEGSNHT